MDIVIALGTGSKVQDLELKYALRGIDKYLSGHANIILSGTKPHWIRNVEHFPMEDVPGKKQFSIFQKIMAVLDFCSDDFIFWNDDHFLLKPLETKDFKYWYEKDLQYWQSKAIGIYQKAITNTLELPGLNNYYTDIHFPIVYNKVKFAKLMNLEWGKKEYVIKSAYTKNESEGFEPAFDLKLSDIRYTTEEINAKIKNRLFFSTGPHAITPFMKNALYDRFPYKSKYER